jgi:Flagellar biosynthesis/type III secretory pathway lipoprotein
MSLKQLEYTRNIEQTLAARIQDLLSPLVGSKGVRAQVTAEVDFTKQEQTRENFNPDPEAVRSSQEIRERNKAAGPEGIPGALTNQPPQAGIAPEEDYPGKDKNGGLAKDLQSEKITKNYEIDRTITHLQSQVGTLKRLSLISCHKLRASSKISSAVIHSPACSTMARCTTLSNSRILPCHA